ncbi:hypothetical protein F4861DRAFT_234879 [Xylaria intraflava]|nr:hypothetical protein F4861DRAFT_234879 [Xylaria intraflava]
MFGGFAPPQLSAEEIELLENEASWSVKSFFATAAVLYICTPTPPCLSSLPPYRYAMAFPSSTEPAQSGFVLTNTSPPAPFVIEVVSSVF